MRIDFCANQGGGESGPSTARSAKCAARSAQDDSFLLMAEGDGR
jgi:hypothetical protein